MIILYDYDEEHDILFIHWGEEKTKHSEEYDNGKFVLDFDEKERIVGIGIVNWSEK